MKKKPVKAVTGMALAAHLDCARETISDYIAKGIIEKLPDGRYDEDDCRKRVLKHLRDRNAGRTGGELSSQRAELAKEQVETVRIKNAALRGDLVSLEAVARQYDALLLITRENILGVPGAKADELAMRTRDEVELILRDALHEALDELSRYEAGGGDKDSGQSPRVS